MIDIIEELTAVHRETGQREIAAGAARTVLVRRSYPAPIEDVWDVITNRERISRWFLPISGDLRLGGHYQLEGHAGGEIVRCEPPHLLAVTWVFGEDPTPADVTEVVVRLSAGPAGQTLFELEHASVVTPQRWAEFGPGAVGVGWDMILLGLGLDLRGESIGDPALWMQSPEAKRFVTVSAESWGTAMAAAGATDAEAAAAAGNTARAYIPEPPAGEDQGG